MLQPEVRHMIAQAIKEVVVAKMLRPEEFHCLIGQSFIVVEHVLGRSQITRAIGGNVHLLTRVLAQRHYEEVLTSDHGRIYQHG